MPAYSRILLPWDSQPQEVVDLDRDGLGKGVQMLLMPMGGRLVDLVNPQQVWTPNGNVIVSPSTNGLAATFDGTDDFYSTSGYPQITGNVGTFFVWCPEIGTQDTAGHVWWGTNSTNSTWFQTGNAVSNNAYSFGQEITGVGASSLIYSSRNTALVWSSSGTAASKRFFLNGVGYGTASGTAPTAFPAGSKNFRFGAWMGGASWDCNGKAVIAGFTTEVWTEAQAKQFHNDPWSTFAPRSIPIPVSAGGGGTTVAGTVGTATASGITGGVDANRTIAGSVGVASALGIQGGVSQSSNTTVTGTVGVATASGIAGGVDANRTIAGVVGVATAEGLQGTVSNTNDTIVTGTVGTATASGVAGTVTWNRTLAGIVGEAIASGITGGVQSGPVAQQIGGGGYLPNLRRKTRKEIHAERVRLGILPEQIRQAAQKVVEKAAEQGDPEEVYEDNTEKYKAMFLREVGATKWAPDYARAIRIQLELMERDAEDALLLM